MMLTMRTPTQKMRGPGFFVSVIMLLSLSACAPQREFVHFSDAGTFHPGPGHSGGDRGKPQGEYDSYELIDHAAPNQGIAPMYQGNQ